MPQLMQLTTVHPRGDIRIAVKECGTLAGEFPGSMELVVADGLGPAERDGMRLFDLGVVGRTRLSRPFLGFMRSVARLRAVRPDILHFHDPELIPVGFVAKLLGVRVIYDVHEDLPIQILNKHWIPLPLRHLVAACARGAEWLAGRAFDAIVPATPKIAERFPRHKTVLVQNFPLSSEFATPVPAPYAARPGSFVYVGGVNRLRGTLQMVEAVNRLDGKADVRLDVAGTFSPPSLQGEVAQLDDLGRVRFHGWLGRAELVELLGNARAGLVVLHPTRSYVDSQPNKLFEYMAAGLPVVASDFPLWRGIVEEAGCGLLVDPLDVGAIADAMSWILEHPAEAEAMGRSGRAAVESRFNWQAEAKHLIGLYRRCL